SIWLRTWSTDIYTLSLHDALPISDRHLAASTLQMIEQVVEQQLEVVFADREGGQLTRLQTPRIGIFDEDARVLQIHAIERRARKDRKSTRLNSSHVKISYAVFCLK